MTQNTELSELKIKRGRPVKGPRAMSRPMSVRLTAEELKAFQQAAGRLGELPTRLLRRAVREIAGSGPDLFDDGLIEMRAMHRELAALGRTLNQITRQLNAGGADPETIELGHVGQAVKAAQAAYGELVKRCQDRWVPVLEKRT